jgi:TRAP-type mannitol/chloroaromatic compound transport system permease small subunit
MERGMDTSWMPLMYPIKSILFIGLVLLIIQGVSETLKCIYAVRNRRWP